MRHTITLIALLGAAAATHAQSFDFSNEFRARDVQSNGTTIHVRAGGTGPAVVLLHGYGETGDMWVPMARDLVRDYTVVVPDLRGMGLSSKPAGGFDKKNQARDLEGVLASLGIQRIELVAHDIGNMVAFAYAAAHPDTVTRLVLIDAPVPGVGPWDEILENPLLWHFRFGGPDMERLVAGRERIYLDRFWNEFSANPARFTEGAREHYAALYAQPGAMRAGFAQFAAFDQDAEDNRAWLAAGGRLTMPVLAVGGEKSFGATMAVVMRAAATNVVEGVVPDSGHWIMEENPAATIEMVRRFLSGRERLSPADIEALPTTGASAGTSGVAGIQSRTLAGNPTAAGPYTIALNVPPNTSIEAHAHRDDRHVVVVSGTWHFGYGEKAERALEKPLGPGSFYSEPAGVPHFARTGAEPVIVYISGYGPTTTDYVDQATDPRSRQAR